LTRHLFIALHRVLVPVSLLALAACGQGSGRPTATPTPTIVLGPLPASVLLPSGSAAPFAVQGDEMAWVGIPRERGVCPRYHVYLANLRAFHPVTVWLAPRCVVITDIRLSAGWIAWVGGIAPAGNIWAMNRATGRVREVAGQVYRIVNHPCPTAGCVPPVAFSLDGNLLVWSHFVFGPRGDRIVSAIRDRVLPNGRARTIYRSDGTCIMQIDPRLFGGRLVWLRARWPRDQAVGSVPPYQCEGPLQTDVMTKLLGRTPHLVTVDGGASNPQTNGRFLSWQDAGLAPPTCVCTGLAILDTATGRRLKISTSTLDARMSSSVLVWISESHLATQVNTFDLAAGLAATAATFARMTTIQAVSGTSASPTFIRALGWPWSRRVVWERDYLSGPLAARARVGIRDVA
jgi:hypothetical protein